MKVGDRVREPARFRGGVLRKVYEMTDRHGTKLGRKSADVRFDGDNLDTCGVWLDDLCSEHPIQGPDE